MLQKKGFTIVELKWIIVLPVYYEGGFIIKYWFAVDESFECACGRCKIVA